MIINADYLIVAVQDGEYILKYKPEANIYYSTEERIEMLESIKIVDEVVKYKAVGVDVLKKLEFDILALGEDHIGERFDIIEKWCKENNKQVVRLKRTQGVSATEIKNEVETLK